MKYDFKCECGHSQVYRCNASKFPIYKESGIPCPSCLGTAEYCFNPKSVGISFAGDAWADKNFKEKEYRKQRTKYMSARQAQSHKAVSLIPNYNGEEAETWEEAQEAARADGKVTETYEPLIKRERLRS
jgi:hypothetical protein